MNFSEKDVREGIDALFEAGWSREQIAAAVGVLPTYVSTLRRTGRTSRNRAMALQRAVDGLKNELGTTRHQVSPGVTIEPAVLERLQELAEAAGFDSPSSFLVALLEAQGVAYVAEIKARRAERERRSAQLQRARAQRASGQARTVQVGDEELPLPDEHGEQAGEASDEK